MSRPTLRRLETLTRGRRTPGDGVAFREARGDLSQWLVAGREARGLSREQVAQITRIQLRTIERLEEGRFDELPADVFVRGFIRGYARCVGLPEEEALARYGTCGFAAAPVASAQAQALLDSMASLAPELGRTVSEPAPLARAPRALADASTSTGTAGAAAARGTPGIPGMIDVDTALARAGVVAVPLAEGSLRDLPAIQVAPQAAPDLRARDERMSSEVLAATVVTDAEPGATATESAARKRRRKGEPAPRLTGPMERDARGRFVRRTGAIAAVDPVQLGLAVEAAAVEAQTMAAPAPVQATVREADVASAVADDAACVAAAAAETRAPASDDSAAIDVAIDDLAGPAPELASPALEAGQDAAASEPVSSPILVVPPVTPSSSGRFGRVTGASVPVPPRTSGIHVAPTLVIDDDDPEDAERARDERAARKDAEDLSTRGWRSFIPPALLDQQKGRQGGLTLAVIILLIVATLTLSYLMRRPSSSGDGITTAPAPTTELLA